MDTQYWSTVEAVAHSLAPRRVDTELAQLSAYLNTHRDAADFFALLDELAAPANAALSPPGSGNSFVAVRDACQPLRDLPPEALPAAFAFAARLLRYQVSKLPPAPRPQPAPLRPPAAVAPHPGGPPLAPAARPQPGRPAAAGPPSRPAAAGPTGPRPPGPLPAAAERRGPTTAPGPRPAGPPGARQTPPGHPAPPPGGRAPVQPAAEQPRPAPPRRPPTMDDMLRQLQAQFGGSTGGPAAEERPRERVESKRDRLRREQEEIRERYRRQQEEDEKARRG